MICQISTNLAGHKKEELSHLIHMDIRFSYAFKVKIKKSHKGNVYQ